MKRKDTVDERKKIREQLYNNVPTAGLDLAKTLKTMRRIANTTQTEYAAICRVSLRILKAIEQGRGNPTLATIRKLLKPFGLDVGVVIKSR